MVKSGKKIIIAVDGPSGSGKSTICKLIAQQMDLSYVDTGAIYRTVALVKKEQNIQDKDDAALKKICFELPLIFEFKDGVNRVKLGNRDITNEIRTPEISMGASSVSAIPVVRASLLDMQRRLATNTPKKGAILDGRDIGTVVFPKADIKIFLTASNEERANRRFKELKEKGMDVDYNKILQETIQRDKQDSQRNIAPLKKADDAIEIDTDGLEIETVKEKVIEQVKRFL